MTCNPDLKAKTPGLADGATSRMITANGLDFCVEELGDPKGEPLLLIMGLGAQMTLWPEPLLQEYVRAGFRVIRYDNRDIGLSSEVDARLKGKPLAAMARYKFRLPVQAPYTLHDHAMDALGLLDTLGIAETHIQGVSMGGMIGQILAARYPERVKSLSLVMSSSNSPRLPTPTPRVVWALQGGSIRGHDEDSAVARSLALWQLIQSPRYPRDPDELEERVRNDYRRSYRPRGILRQMRGVLATGDLSRLSRSIDVPTTVIHGTADPLIRPAAGRQLAGLIANAELHLVDGMGHDLPEPLHPMLARHTVENAERA